MKHFLILLVIATTNSVYASSAYYKMETVEIIKKGNEHSDYRIKTNDGLILDIDEDELYFSSPNETLRIGSLFSSKSNLTISVGESIFYRKHYRFGIHKALVLAVNSHKEEFLIQLGSSIKRLKYDNNNIYMELKKPRLQYLKSGKDLIEVKVIGLGLKKNDSAKHLLIENTDKSLDKVKRNQIYVKDQCNVEICTGDQIIKVGTSKINTVIALSLDGFKAFLDDGETVNSSTSTVHIHKEGALSLKRINEQLVQRKFFFKCMRQLGYHVDRIDVPYNSGEYRRYYYRHTDYQRDDYSLASNRNQHDHDGSYCKRNSHTMLDEYINLDSQEDKDELLETYLPYNIRNY